MRKQNRYFNAAIRPIQAQQIIDNNRDTELNLRPVLGEEMQIIEYLAAMDYKMGKAGDVMRERLKLIPNGWRQWRLMVSIINRLVPQVYSVIPVKTRRHIENLCNHGEVVIRIKPTARVPEHTLISDDDLCVVCDAAMENECAICLKQGKEIDRCPLRKAMLHIAQPFTETPTSCGYQLAALATIEDRKKK